MTTIHDQALRHAIPAPLGPFPARLLIDGTGMRLEVVVGQTESRVDVESACAFTGDVLRELFGPSVRNPEVWYDIPQRAVKISYATGVESEYEEVEAMSMAALLFAAFLAMRLQESLTEEWLERLRGARVLGPTHSDPRRLLGTGPAAWAEWGQ